MTAPARAHPRRRAADPWSLGRYVRALRLAPVEVAGRTVSPSIQKVVLLVLMTYADPDGTGAYQSMEQLGDDANTDERTARRAVRALELGGHLVTLLGGRRGQDGRRANRYRIVVRAELVEPAEPEPVERVVRPVGADVDLVEPGGALPPAAGGSAPPTCPTPGGNPLTPRPAAPHDDIGPPGCDAHPDRRRPFCPDCRQVRRGGWPAGCRRHRRRRSRCADCAPTPTPPRFAPPPAPPPPRSVDWRAIAAEHWTGSSPPGRACGPLTVDPHACPACGGVDELNPLPGTPCRRCVDVTALPQLPDVDLGGAG